MVVIDMWTPGYSRLSVRARKTLNRLGVQTLDDLCAADFESAKGCGPVTARELRKFRGILRRRKGNA